MAKSGIPGALERRHLVEKDLAAAQAQRIADAYLAADRHVEAVDFLGKLEDADALRDLRARAVEESFRLQRARRDALRAQAEYDRRLADWRAEQRRQEARASAG